MVRDVCMNSDDKGLKFIGGMLIVPAAKVPGPK
jgi:hypothetical protein